MKLISYSTKNSFARKLTSILTVFGVALVVFVFSAVLMLVNGLQTTLVATGSDDNMIVIRRAAQTEIVSIVGRDMADIIKADPGIERLPDGKPLFTNEVLVLINLLKRSNNEPSNVPVRGVSDMSLAIRPNVKIVQGRMWHPGTSEIIAGRKVAADFQGCGIGETVRFGQREWTVVGIFEAGNNGFESELWGDVDQLMPAFERPVFSSLTFKVKPGTDMKGIEERLKNRSEADDRCLAGEGILSFAVTAVLGLRDDPGDVHLSPVCGRSGCRRHDHNVCGRGQSYGGNRDTTGPRIQPRASVVGLPAGGAHYLDSRRTHWSRIGSAAATGRGLDHELGYLC